ncbi:MAG: allantoicase [Thiothrix sp.]|nr:allantoicase [Thiothrix sp.]HPQ97003.1 allantoicase [Thiolinea sp.]
MRELLNTLQHQWIDLAQPRLGAKGIHASDEFFAPLERMLNPEPAVFIPGRYDDNGKWMDGWETRRKRGEGYDHAIVRICPGVIHGIDLDTSHFTGNYAPSASVDACHSATEPDADTVWTPILESSTLQGNSHNVFAIENRACWNYLRLNIYPDGGVARLRVYGEVHRDWSGHETGMEIDLLAMENGGRALCANDMHFGHMSNLIAPGRGINMGDGWETRRRREPGHDWAILRLGHVGEIRRIVIDTAHFKGNFPHECSVSGAFMSGGDEASIATQSLFWRTLLPPQPMHADSIHEYLDEIQAIGPLTHLRLNIFPDGGVSRLRAFGHLHRG